MNAEGSQDRARPFSLIVQISDPHMRPGEDGDDAAEKLSDAVRRIAAMPLVPDAVLLTGDIANGGAGEEYERAAAILSELPVPVHPLPGNHDDRDGMRRAFADHPGIAAAGEFLQYEARCGAVRVLVCDTLDAGNTKGGGRLDETRRQWLAERLEEDDSSPTMIAMHHPPILTGMRGFDEIALAPADHAELETLLLAHPRAELIVAGHVHRGAVGAIAGKRVITAPSVHLQSTLGLGHAGGPDLVEAPAGMLIHIQAPTLGFVSHIELIERGRPASLSDPA